MHVNNGQDTESPKFIKVMHIYHVTGQYSKFHKRPSDAKISHISIHICPSTSVLKAQCDAVNTCAWYQFDWSHNKDSVPSDEALLYLKVTLLFLIKPLNIP